MGSTARLEVTLQARNDVGKFEQPAYFSEVLQLCRFNH